MKTAIKKMETHTTDLEKIFGNYICDIRHIQNIQKILIA